MIEGKKKDHFGNRTNSVSDIDHNFKPVPNTERVSNFKIGGDNESN